MAEMVNVISNSLAEAQTFMSIPQVIGRTYRDVPPKVFALTAKIQSIALKTVVSIDSCGLQGLRQIANTGVSILGDIFSCINNEINTCGSSFTVESLQNALQDVQVVIAANVKVVVDELGDEIFDHLAEIKKEASAIGVNIINCTEDREKDIKQLFVDFYNKTTECAVERIDEVLDSFRAILNDIQKGNSEFKNLTQRMDDCGKDVACMEQVIQEIAKVIQEMPNTVMGDIKKANKKNQRID
ncbi:hypothetical protein NQ317_008351 [Molorchus minor]|uniref:Uncharacterized protein n=1 Tax=Molorchus minor TaxID=1323400 RepID=A0ABQ9K3Y2_9CUCU|nr:hypothetical protein NQ317_008351 [Molorchus minor]